MTIHESTSKLKSRTITSVLFVGAGTGTSFVIRFVSLALMARLLPIDIFGLLGLMTVFLLILRDVSDLGLGSALIQKEKVNPTEVATVFWTNLILGIVSGMILWLLSDSIAELLRENRLAPMLRILAYLLPMNATTVVSNAMLNREMHFDKIAIRDMGGEITFGIVGVLLAGLGYELWSIAGAVIAQWTVRALLTYVFWIYRPRPLFKIDVLKELSGYSMSIFCLTLLERVMANIDYFIVGRLLGTTALGYYMLAFQLVILPAQRLTGILRRVLFPSLSKIQHDKVRLGRGLLSLIEALALTLLPLTIFYVALAPWLVVVFYSSRWSPAVLSIQILAAASFFYGLDIVDTIFFAIGKPRIRLAILTGRAILFVVIAPYLGLVYGIEGIAASILVTVSISALIGIYVISSIIEISPQAIWDRIKYPTMSCLAMTGLLIPAIRLLSTSRLPDWAILTTLGGLMFLVYLSFITWKYLSQVLIIGRKLRVISS